LYWHDSLGYQGSYSPLNGQVVYFHLDETRRILGNGGVLFPSGGWDRGDARMVAHPPGYAILMAALHRLSASSGSKVRVELLAEPLRWIQILLDSTAAVIVFWIAAELLSWVPALIAGLLVAVSPHLAYYSLLLSPDSLAVLPILVAVYLLARNVRRPRLSTAAAVGLMIGVSCWLRSNALLLAPWLSFLTFLLIDRNRRLRHALVLLAAYILVMAPLTFRNWIVYQRLIPLSIGSGITLVEGIADYDSDNHFGLPRTDLEVQDMDAEWHGRLDYAKSLWTPDGIERDRDRFARGLAIARSNPAWFLGLMARRMGFMLRYNDLAPQDTSFTTIAPTISEWPACMRQPDVPRTLEPVWAASPAEFMSRGLMLASRAERSQSGARGAAEIICDPSGCGPEFSFGPLPTRRCTDYLLVFSGDVQGGPIDGRIGTIDGHAVLASVPIPVRSATGRSNGPEQSSGSNAVRGPAEMPPLLAPPPRTVIPFASGSGAELNFLLYSGDPRAGGVTVTASRLELFEMGPTQSLWTRYPRVLIGALQRKIFKTWPMRVMILLGMLTLAIAGRSRAIVLLIAVPAYYLCFQSALHTEYRYVLVIHYLLFILAGAMLFLVGSRLRQGCQQLLARCVNLRSQSRQER
jgi:hypothetical protein